MIGPGSRLSCARHGTTHKLVCGMFWLFFFPSVSDGSARRPAFSTSMGIIDGFFYVSGGGGGGYRTDRLARRSHKMCALWFRLVSFVLCEFCFILSHSSLSDVLFFPKLLCVVLFCVAGLDAMMCLEQARILVRRCSIFFGTFIEARNNCLCWFTASDLLWSGCSIFSCLEACNDCLCRLRRLIQCRGS